MGKVLLIGGPTASGKSALAFKKAKNTNGVIINGDSLQLYKGFEILTAQPTPEEQSEVPHQLYGFLDPSQIFSVGKWLPLVTQEIERALREEKLPIVVGGTGLYLKTLMDGMSPIPSIPPEVRKNIKDNQPQNFEDLKKVDPSLAARISPQDRQRTIRGLEVFYGTGKPLSFWQTLPLSPPPYTFETVIFMPSKDELEKRMASRLKAMVDHGVIEEVAHLMTLPLCLNAKKAIGFREFEAYITGDFSLEEALELTLIHTRQYAKRQLTWFRHQFKK